MTAAHADVFAVAATFANAESARADEAEARLAAVTWTENALRNDLARARAKMAELESEANDLANHLVAMGLNLLDETAGRLAAERELHATKAELEDANDLVVYATALLDQEPLWLSLARLAWSPVTFTRFVIGAARSAL